MEIFETDDYTDLPKYIDQSIIILGKNKTYDIDIDIIPRCKGNCYFTYIEFNYI